MMEAIVAEGSPSSHTRLFQAFTPSTTINCAPIAERAVVNNGYDIDEVEWDWHAFKFSGGTYLIVVIWDEEGDKSSRKSD